MENSVFHNNAVFFIEVDKIKPNPFQPRREFDPAKLTELADSIRMYGILQPLVVTRKEVIKEDGGLSTEYELIAGERRLRASKLAGLREVPALIRSAEDDDRTKLELAIIENLQREDLNSVDRALAFQQLANQFNFTHAEIGKKMGRSREYVSNTLRLLMLPEDIQDALRERKISEGHTRPLLMLIDRPEEQQVLFKEIMLRKMTVRDAEKVARRIAYDKVRKKAKMYDPEIVEIEEEVAGVLGTRVHIEQKDKGGKIEIDFFDQEGLKKILEVIRSNAQREDPFAKYPMSNIVEEDRVVDNTGELTQDNIIKENPVDEEQPQQEVNEEPVQSFTQEEITPEPVVEEVVEEQQQSVVEEVVETPQEPVVDEIQEETKEVVIEGLPDMNTDDVVFNEDPVLEEVQHADFPEEDTVGEEDDDELYSLKDFSI